MLRSRTWARRALFVLLTASAVAVPSVLGAADDPAKPAHPFRYYIGHEVVVVDVTLTAKTTRKIETLSGTALARCLATHTRRSTPAAPATAAPGTAPAAAAPAASAASVPADPDLCVTQTTVTTREGTTASKLVPDPNVHADIRLGSSGWTDDELTIELREGMLLGSINAKSTGRAGEVIASIAKFAGVLMGGIPGLAATSGTPPARPAIAGSTCDPFVKPYGDLPDPTRLVLWERQQLCEQYDTIRQLQKAGDALVADRLKLEHDIRGATDQELKLLLKKLETVQAAIELGQENLAPRVKQLQTQLEAFVTALDLGTTTATRRHNQVLDLSELSPLSKADKTPFFVHGMTEAAAESVILTRPEFKPSVRKLWEAAKLIVTLDPMAPITCSPDGKPVPVPAPPTDNKQLQIAFRQGAPARLTVFLADQAGDPAAGPSANPPSTLRVVADRFDNVVHRCSPVTSVIFKRSAWAKRELSLTFDEKGRPVRLQRVAASDFAAMAAAAASGATALRDEIKTTVAAGVEITENRNKIELAELTARLDRVKKEKEVLDAQLALQVAGAGFDTSLRQQAATNELNRLQAEITLANAESTANQRALLEQLKLQLDLVKQELEVLKAQAEIAKLKPQP